MELFDVAFSYDNDKLSPVSLSKYLFYDIELRIDMGTRICIVGPNGIGKTSFLNLLSGALQPTKGQIIRHKDLTIGVYDQHFEDLPSDKTPIEYLQSLNPSTSYQEIRNYLGAYNLPGHAHTISLKNCSGGQKARVMMASISMIEPNVLILDEPTNHLDIETIDGLIEAINNFEGAVILVTHNVNLIQRCMCDLYEMRPDGLYYYKGGIDHYFDSIQIDNVTA